MAVPVFAEVLGTYVCELVFGRNVADVDPSLLDQFLNEEVPWGYVFDSRAVCPVACDV